MARLRFAAPGKRILNMEKYTPKDIEPKWQEYWDREKIFQVAEDITKKKFYGLIEFPYPSGAGLHVGHSRSNTAMDVICRKRRMQGEHVLFPIGFDAFGLPTENFAIKTGRPPADVTAENVATFTRQLKELGFSFDWSRVVNTTDPAYYRWTQWIFLQLFKHGLAYKKKQPINWCPKDKIGLANEEVVNGACERCGTLVEKREKEQWMLAITKYADKLLAGLKTVDYIPQAKLQQEHWIGRSEGLIFTAPVKDTDLIIQTFSAHFEAFCADTFVVIAPDHPFLSTLLDGIPNKKEILNFCKKLLEKRASRGFVEEKESEGIFTGRYIVDPVGNGDLPIWVASYALADYGTGIVKCSAHDERDFAFAKKYAIRLKSVLFPEDPEQRARVERLEECFVDMKNGILSEPKEFAGKRAGDVREDIKQFAIDRGFAQSKVQYKLRDWVFSRQRYWGEPIPLVYCESCAENRKQKIENRNDLGEGERMNPGWIALPEQELPLTLPEVEKYQPTDTGESPLAAMTEWVNTTCPRCGGPAKRETDTMPNWAGSSWYFLRYCDPNNDKEFASMEKLRYWMVPTKANSQKPIANSSIGSELLAMNLGGVPVLRSSKGEGVDWYNGGMEHTVLHLLYSRFWNQFLYDIGVVPTREPYAKRTSHGLILGPDGEKMSKSRGNVVNPDEIVQEYGADTLRTYILFMGPFDQPVAWDTNGLVGVRRFLEKIWRYTDSWRTNLEKDKKNGDTGYEKEYLSKEVESLLHKTIKKVSSDIEEMRFNTAIAQLMIFINHISRELPTGWNQSEPITIPQMEKFLKLLSPFVPHLAEELWCEIGNKDSISFAPWPQYDPALIAEDTATIAIQVNGKLRDTIEVAADALEDEVKKLALASEKVQKWLGGKEPKKIIYVARKLVSIVTED